MECLKNLMDERTEKALAELRETPEFMELLTKQEKLLDALLSGISDEQTRKAVTTYESQKNHVSSIQLEVVYKAGALDAIKLLKAMGVI